MHISLIGMSNIGKSWCSRKLAAHHGFTHVDCDALIETKLKPELGSLTGIQGMAKWMGFPWEASYKANSERYLDCERNVLREALSAHGNTEKAVVMDTTGSIVYTGPEYLQALQQKTRVVYFEASEAHIADLYKAFLAFPKPVIWGESFAPKDGETPKDTLDRCYPELLRDRARRYKEVAHVVIPFEKLKTCGTTVDRFVLETLRQP
jgi:shikimate kinase